MNIIKIPEILLPNKSVDLEKWAVIACDQFTSQKKYWDKLDEFCGDVSTLRIIMPEIYIKDNTEERVEKINQTMRDYLQNGVFDTVNGFILTVRTTKYGHRRVGLLVAFDLEEYDPFERRAVRATEATVKERLPIRVQVRQNAPIELPHALVLIDDDQKTVIEPIFERRDQLKKLYSTKLNMDGGTLEGYLVDDPQAVIDALDKLTSPEKIMEKYNSTKPFVFAVGDGNHSIATARVCWDKIKEGLTEEERKNHPARYCLVEVNNIYEEDLNFEPIFRLVTEVDKKDFITKMQKTLDGSRKIKLFANNTYFEVNVSKNTAEAIKQIQAFIDNYFIENNIPQTAQDYIHGEDHLIETSLEHDGIAIFMPKLKKADLFKYVAKKGSMTRKSFSMGEAEEKRYYFEARKVQ